MNLAGAGPTDQDAVELLSEKVALRKITHKALVDGRAFELEVVESFAKALRREGLPV